MRLSSANETGIKIASGHEVRESPDKFARAATTMEADKVCESRSAARPAGDFAALLQNPPAPREGFEGEAISALTPEEFVSDHASDETAPLLSSTGLGHALWRVMENDLIAGGSARVFIAEVEKIVAALQTRSTAEGAWEVSLHLSLSRFQGVSIRLRVDARGRVRAELLAPHEEAQSVLERHIGELRYILQERGVEVAGVRVAVGSGAEERGAAGPGDKRHRRPSPRRPARGGLISPAPQSSAESPPAEPEDPRTYRA